MRIYTRGKSNDQLISLLREWAQVNGDIPSRRQFDADANMPSSGIYRQRFGSWGNALRMAGMNPKKPTPGPLCRQRRDAAKRGSRSGNWKGGRVIDKNGYVHIWEPQHPNANCGRDKSYVLEHRKVMADYLGRPLLRSETVHHKDGQRANNEISNLELWTSEHPAGQRVTDKIKWAKDFLKKYGIETIGNIHENPELLND